MASKSKILDGKWIAKNGSIFLEKTYSVKTEYDTKYTTQDAVAFNVGDKVAEHIVNLHNKDLSQK